MTAIHLLADYESLVQQHQEQFTPALLRLQTSVNETLHQLQQQEQALVDAQAQQLTQLQERLATDARCLLNSVELQTFIAQVQTIPPSRRWNQTEPAPEVDVNPANWQLAQTDFTVGIHNYKATVDHDAYDDERTHTAIGYEVTIQVGNQNQRLEVLTQRVYSPVEQRSYSLRQQLDYYFEEAVTELLSPQKMTAALQGQLVQEMSYLLGCAAHLLTLTPHQVQFHYSSTEATG